MTYYVRIIIWAPETGSELELESRAREAEAAVRECAMRGLRERLPLARIVRSRVAREAESEGGALHDGYRVRLTVATPPPPSPAWTGGARQIRNWVESDVSTALLELLNPMSVDRVSVRG